MRQLLDFETEVESIEADISELRRSDSAADDILKQIKSLEKKRDKILKKIYDGLDDWQVCQVARHSQRPQAQDYIDSLIDDFIELQGDRLYGDDKAIIAGMGRFGDRPVFVVGNQKGDTTHKKIQRNFGMSNPEGYRKVARIMNLADKFRIPLISFVDTPGAYPGIGAEERGQSGAIGYCLRLSSELRAPYLSIVIGEGGSGGALALAAGDFVGILQYATYSVISPEGCASILWKDARRMAEAATILGLTASKLHKLGLVDEIISEPAGGAHRYPKLVVEYVRSSLNSALNRLENLDEEKLLTLRRNRWRNYGICKEN